jgi:hypothetical protein
MLKAVIRNGKIVPLEPLPPQWRDGKEVSVTETDAPEDQPADSERLTREAADWVQAVREAAAPFDPEDWARLEAALKEIKREGKERMRRKMGSP